MQIFVPFDNFKDIAACLDNKRLFKQLLEGTQILRVIVEGNAGKAGVGWANHPAVLAWQYNPQSLAEYCDVMLGELIEARGYRVLKLIETLYELIQCARAYEAELRPNLVVTPWGEAPKPIWWGRKEVHDSQRARLLQKEFEHYSQFGWHLEFESEGTAWRDMDYQWPWYVEGDDEVLTYELVERGNTAEQRKRMGWK